MKKVFRAIAVVAGIAALIATAATASVGKKAAGGDVCVLLPDTATSIRWVHYDTPALKAAFKKSGVSAQFYNADDDAQKQKSQANQCLTSSVTGNTAGSPMSGSRIMPEKKLEAALFGFPGRTQMVGKRIPMPSKKPRRLKSASRSSPIAFWVP